MEISKTHKESGGQKFQYRLMIRFTQNITFIKRIKKFKLSGYQNDSRNAKISRRK